MEKMGLKNIKIVIISITILVVMVLVLKLQIMSKTSEKKLSNQQETTSQAQEYEIEDDDHITGNYEEPEQDTQENTSEEKTTKKDDKEEPKKQIKTKDYDNGEFYFPEYEADKRNKKISNEETKTIIDTEKKKQATRVVIPEVIKEKTPKETFDYALLEMRKGNLNSAIYEFNNAIDIADNPDMALKARKYLAECYERKGINSEAFDLYEYIYLETGKKSDLLELHRIAKKTKRTYTAYTYIQSYIEEHPEEAESLSDYLSY